MSAQEFEFEYHLLNNIYISSGDYTGYGSPFVGGFFTMSHQHMGKLPLDGWKIHVSIDDEGGEGSANIANAWRIAAEILMSADVYCFKIVTSANIPLRDKIVKENEQKVSQRGKQITIYSGATPDKDWQNILQRITDGFVEHNIQPSYLPQSDNPIKGSPYFSYRHERLGNRVEFNVPPGEEDPYVHTVDLTLPQGVNITRKQWPVPVVVQDIQIPEEQLHPDNEMPAVVQPDPADEDESSGRSFCCGCRR